MVAQAGASTATHKVECLAANTWYPLWKDLRVEAPCTTISSVQVNGQGTNTIILGTPAALAITGQCFTGATACVIYTCC